jgi:DNA-binding CsgD family transcriptional regulator
MSSIQEMILRKFEHINRIIADLYRDDYPLHSKTNLFFQGVMSIIPFDKAAVTFFSKDDHGNYTSQASISLNWDLQFDKRYHNYYCRFDDALPILDQPAPIVFRSSSFFDHEVRMNTIYWNEYLVPTDSIYAVEGNLALKNKKGLRGAFSFYRGAEGPDFSEEELQMLRLFQPHLSNLFQYYDLENPFGDETYIKMDDCRCVGVGVLDYSFRLIRSNNHFKMLVNKEQSIDVLRKIQYICQTMEGDDDTSVSTECKLTNYPIFIEISRVTTPRSDHIRLDTPTNPENSRCYYYCMVYDVSNFLFKSLQLAKSKFALTEQEVILVKYLLQGKSNSDIALEMFVSLPTVKKYMSVIYEKMQIKSKKEIFETLGMIK